MIRVSVQDLCLYYFAPRRRSFGKEYPLYIIRDADTVFYVGHSYNPIRRFYSHMSQNSGSPVGDFIRLHLPWSLTWQVEFLTLEDCRELIEQHLKGHTILRTERLYMCGDTAERALIARHCPCFNVELNKKPRPVPKAYWQYALPLTTFSPVPVGPGPG